MKRWLSAECSDLFLDAVSSVNIHSQRRYGEDLVLANYPNRPATLDSMDALWDALCAVEAEAAALEGHPRAYLGGILAGLKMILRIMQGDDVPYADQILAMQQIVSREITPGQIDALGSRLDKKLTDQGYRQSSLAEKMSAFLSDYTLPSEQVVPVTRAYLDRCKQSTNARILPIPAESAISDVRGVRGAIFSGNSAYLGDQKGRLSFNLDRQWSLPTFVGVLCHEGYPGHHAFYGRWDTLFQQGLLPAEAAFYIKNTPTNALFEGVPENALHFLEWDVPGSAVTEVTEEEKLRFATGEMISDLKRMYQQNACHYVNLNGMDKAGAIEYLTGSGLFSVSEAESSHRFFTDATRRTYYPSYYYGRWMVHNAYRRVAPERRGEYFALTYDRPHTTNTYLDAIRAFTGGDWEPYETEGSYTS